MAPFFVKGEKIVLKRNGVWFADGIEITHEQTRDLFFRSIHWDEKTNDEGQHFYLEVGYERLFFDVEDTPYFVVSLGEESDGRLFANLTNSVKSPIQHDLLSYENTSLYLTLSNGFKARFLAAPYYDLLKHLEEDATGYYVEIAGQKKILLKK